MFRARRGDDDLRMDTERRAHGVFVEVDRGPDLHQPCTRGGWLQQPASGHCSRSWITCPCLPPGFSHPVAWSRGVDPGHMHLRELHTGLTTQRRCRIDWLGS